jgi:predicted Na+-dependent transporter
VKLFVFIGLPFVLISYAFGLMAGERMEYGTFGRSCMRFIKEMLRCILKGVAALSSALASALPTRFAHYRVAAHLIIHLVLLNVVFWVLLACFARFAQAE